MKSVLPKGKYLLLVFGFLILSIVCACSKLKGEFGVKSKFGDTFRHIQGKLEISVDDKVDWVYKFASQSKRISIGIIVLKKELVWVEVFAESTYIGPGKSAVHGTFEKYEPGDYKLMILNIKDDHIITEIPFLVYSDKKGY